MAELEIHHEEGEKHHDPLGQRVGIMAAVLAVLLAVVTIASHRTHTEAIIARSGAKRCLGALSGHAGEIP